MKRSSFLYAYAALTVVIYTLMLTFAPSRALPRSLKTTVSTSTSVLQDPIKRAPRIATAPAQHNFTRAQDVTLSAMTSDTSGHMKMPAIMYGTAWKKERTAALVEQAVKAGFKGIDTACQPKHYQEDQVGLALGRLQEAGIHREELFIQTKFTSVNGQDPNNIPYDPTAPLQDQVAQSFAKSEANLGTSYVDSLVLHSPLRSYDDTMTVWRAMEQIHSAGRARQIGLSNTYDLSLLQRLYADAVVKPSVLQNRFYAQSNHDVQLREWCKQTGIQYQSFWTLTANPHAIRSPEIANIASSKGKTPEQVFFKFVMQEGIVPLSGTKDPKHMREDLEVETSFSLDDSEMQAIRSVTY